MNLKIIKVIILLLFLFINFLLAEDILNFFPHNLGDTWVYHTKSWDYSISYQSRSEVIFDSTDINGYSYVIVKYSSPSNASETVSKIPSEVYVNISVVSPI